MKKLFVATFLAVMLTSFPAFAELQCNTRDSVVKQLKEIYNEDPVAIGVTHNGGLIEVFANGKTWTITITAPNGFACIVSAGEGWRTLHGPDPASLGKGA